MGTSSWASGLAPRGGLSPAAGEPLLQPAGERSALVNSMENMRRTGALVYATLVIAEATAMPGLKYLAPFAGCTVADAWTWQGRDTLIVYDDLTTHARSQ